MSLLVNVLAATGAASAESKNLLENSGSYSGAAGWDFGTKAQTKKREDKAERKGLSQLGRQIDL